MAARAHRHDGRARDRFFREPQTSTGDGIGRALMHRHAPDPGGIHRPDDRGVSRVDFNDLDAVPEARGLEAREDLGAGERGEHAGLRRIDRFEFGLLLLEVEFFDDDRLAGVLGQLGDPIDGIADERQAL